MMTVLTLRETLLKEAYCFPLHYILCLKLLITKLNNSQRPLIKGNELVWSAFQ
jgi:hypothetical protein